MTQPTNRKTELKYLLIVLPLTAAMFLMAYLSFIDREIPTVLESVTGPLDIARYFKTFFPNALYGLIFCTAFGAVHIVMRKKLPDADPYILPAVALLAGIGAVMMFRLSPDLADIRNSAIMYIMKKSPEAGVTNNVLLLAQLGTKHFLRVMLGMLLMVGVFYAFNKRVRAWLSTKKYLLIALSMGLIFLTLMAGTKIHGRSLWLWGFQTVEFVKLLMLLFISGYLYEKGKAIEATRKEKLRSWLPYAGPFFAMWFFALLPLFIQKDLGPTFLIFSVFLVMLHWAGIRGGVSLLFVALIGAAGYFSYKFGYPSMVRTRFDILFDPFGNSESMARALWAISSGGFWGSGIGYGQPHSIPIVHSDYNFTAICEELGMIGGFSVILLFAVLVFRCFRIASGTDHMYRKALVMGIGTMIGLQAFIIIAGNLGIIPLTGITLPFISYGGSSMFIHFIMIGMVLKISGERK